MNFSIGPYTIEQRTEYSKIKLYNNETKEYVEDTELLGKILDDWHKQTVCDDEYFKIDGTKLVGVKYNFHEKNVKYVFVPAFVTEICEDAFKDCSFCFINLPNGLKTIGHGAFAGCRSLDYIKIPDSVKDIGNAAFCDCLSLSQIKLSNIEIISNEMFYRCIELKNIELPDSIEEIETFAFGRCKKLENIRLSNNLKTIDAFAFTECSKLKEIILPDSLRHIHDSSFISTGIKNIDIPDGVIEIGESAFAACKNLENIKLPNNIKTLKKTTFMNCIKLKNLVLPNNISKLDGQVFYNTPCLDVINIPKNLNIIENHPFENSNINTLVIDYDLKSLGIMNLEDAGYGLIGVSSITKLIIDNSVKIISPDVLGEKTGRHIYTIDYKGTKNEFEEFKLNNKELFVKLPNLKEINFLEDEIAKKDIEKQER